MLKWRKLKDFNPDNRFVLIVNFHNRFNKEGLKEKKFVTQGLTKQQRFTTRRGPLKKYHLKPSFKSVWKSTINTIVTLTANQSKLPKKELKKQVLCLKLFWNFSFVACQSAQTVAHRRTSIQVLALSESVRQRGQMQIPVSENTLYKGVTSLMDTY